MIGKTITKPVRVPDGVLRLLRDLIHERAGVFFEDHRLDLLQAKLEPLAQTRGCESFLEYYYLLKDNDAAEWEHAWEALSVLETYFWREMSQINALVQGLIPEWINKRSPAMRIWSAACATGEEPYTIAIALAEAGYGALPIEIVASDANPMALEKAQTGIYRERSFRALPLNLRQKYFEPVREGWKISPAIAQKVKFHRANLIKSEEIAPLARAQVIFCRNVFIYFSPHAIRQTLAMMALKIPRGGHLFVGASESLLRLTADFELTEIAGGLVYVRT